MFRRLLALWSLLSLLLASGPVFAGWVDHSVASVVSAAVQTEGPVVSSSDEAEAGSRADASPLDEERTSSTWPEAEADAFSIDPMDWPEGIELLGILSRASLLSHATVPHIRHAMPNPCLGSLQRPPCARA